MKSRVITTSLGWVMGVSKTLSAVLLLGLLPIQSTLAAAINAIDFNALPGDKIEIRLDFDAAPPEPSAYTIQQPARIALDLPGVKSELDKKKHTLDFGNAQSVMVLEASGRTRVIVNLVEMADYQMRVEGNSLYVVVGNDETKEFLKPTSSQLEAQFSQTAVDKEITSVDFQRGEEGEGKLLLTLSDPSIAVDVSRQGRYINLIFSGVGMPDNLRRRYDVVDFATPVKTVTANVRDGNATVQVEPTGEYDYLAYQVDETYVLSVRPLDEEEIEARNKEFMYTGERLSLNFQDIEVRAVLQLIADFTELNLVASDTVQGTITLRLQNVPWDQALDLVLKTKGLDKRKVGNVLMVAPAAEIAARERQEIETNRQLEELSPLQTEYIRVLYANAADIVGLFEGQGTGEDTSASILSSRGQVIVDERTNSLLITETVQKIEEVRRLIRLIDIPVRQVLIESRIVVANSDFSRQLGIKWGGGIKNSDTYGGSSSVASGSLNSVVTARNTETLVFPEALVVDLGVQQAGATSFAVDYVNNRFDLNAELSALESTGEGEVISQPKVITGDKQQATIKSGQQVPYLESSSSGRTTVKFKDAVLKLDVTPNITPDDRIIMDLVINQDEVAGFINGELNSQIPIIDTTELVTQVLVDNGETIVLGGVFQMQDITQVTKTPYLGDIPYLGRLFRRTTDTKEKTETLIFITPRILSDSLLD
jgi:type IV pilus assembly protein PilQ